MSSARKMKRRPDHVPVSAQVPALSRCPVARQGPTGPGLEEGVLAEVFQALHPGHAPLRLQS